MVPSAVSTPLGPLAPLSRRFRRFGELECRNDSPVYFDLSLAVAEDEALLELVSRLGTPQPNLFFAATRFLGAPYESAAAFRGFVLDHAREVLDLMRARRTQTNEVGRCAVLLPALAALPQPLALLEVGASAGLCLFPDRYAYEYRIGDARHALGHGPVRLATEARGALPVPRQLPAVVWRTGLDLAPIDVRNDAEVRWLEACVWPDQTDRLARLRAAIGLARGDPPVMVRGDAIADLLDVAASAPREATLVVFHSAVLSYLDAGERQRFAATVRRSRAVWLANEGAGIVHPSPEPDPAEASFLLTSGDTVLARSHPHGRWIEWMAGDWHPS